MCNIIEHSSSAPDRFEHWKECIDEGKTIPFLHTQEEILVEASVETFGLLGLAWLLVYVLVWIARWVRTGFRQSASRP
jgi:hypothetical protein